MAASQHTACLREPRQRPEQCQAGTVPGGVALAVPREANLADWGGHGGCRWQEVCEDVVGFLRTKQNREEPGVAEAPRGSEGSRGGAQGGQVAGTSAPPESRASDAGPPTDLGRCAWSWQPGPGTWYPPILPAREAGSTAGNGHGWESQTPRGSGSRGAGQAPAEKQLLDWRRVC